MSVELGIVITIIVNVATIAFTVGNMKQKTKDNETKINETKSDLSQDLHELKEDVQKEIDEIKKHQSETSVILQSINNNLADLNSKFTLLLNGQLVIGGRK